MPWLSRNVFLGLCIFCGFVQAQEVGSDEAQSGQTIVNKSYSGKQSLEWEKIQTKLGALKGKLDAQMNLVEALTANSPDAKDVNSAIKLQDLKREHLKLQKMIVDYNELNIAFLTKYPERGIKESRIYNRVKSKALQLNEKDETLDARAKRLHAKIMSQYSQPSLKNSSNNKKSQGVSKKNSEEVQKTDKNDVTDQIIFEK